MASTVIDSLLVTLGLDSSNFKKGADEAERSQKKFRESTKKTGDEITSSLKKIGGEVAGLFVAFESVKATLSYFGDLNTELANLGRFSRNIGMSAHDVNGWGQAIELAGGKVADAQTDLAKLQGDIVAFNTKGEISPLLLLFQRTGVAIQDANGKTRKLTDIYKDLGDVLRSTDQATAHAWATQAGLSDSTFNLISMEARKRQELLDLAERNNKVTDDTVARAAELQKQWVDIQQTVKSIAVEIYQGLAPAVSTVLGAVKSTFGVFKDLFAIVVSGWQKIGDLLNIKIGDGTVGGFLKDQWEQFKGDLGALRAGIGRAAGEARASGQGSISTGPLAPPTPGPGVNPGVAGTTGARNNNPGNLRWVAGMPNAIGRDDRGFAIFRTWQDGVDAARRQVGLDYNVHGQRTVSDIIKSWAPASDHNNTDAYIADVSKRLGVGANDQLSPSQFNALASAIFVHEGSIRASQFAAQAATTAAGPALAGNSTSHETNVEVGKIEIHTQATDANGIAGSIGPAVKRKVGVIAQANTGMS